MLPQTHRQSTVTSSFTQWRTGIILCNCSSVTCAKPIHAWQSQGGQIQFANLRNKSNHYALADWFIGDFLSTFHKQDTKPHFKGCLRICSYLSWAHMLALSVIEESPEVTVAVGTTPRAASSGPSVEDTTPYLYYAARSTGWWSHISVDSKTLHCIFSGPQAWLLWHKSLKFSIGPQIYVPLSLEKGYFDVPVLIIHPQFTPAD